MLRISAEFSDTTKCSLAIAFVIALALWAYPTMGIGAEGFLDPDKLEIINKAVFEVVVAKPVEGSLTYETPLPLHLLPYSVRTDKYYSIGTAFALGPSQFVSAAHVMLLGAENLFGEVRLRDRDGTVYDIDKITKFSERRDFAVFSLKGKTAQEFLPVNTKPELNQRVSAVGNALGEGIVIRDGLYTSSTPEHEKGEWKQIRFSAAASPGSSGGPLLDKDGKVIGIVLRKSPNENLNYALPISEVLEAKPNKAVLHKVGKGFLENMTATRYGVWDDEAPLPKSYQELHREMIEGYNFFSYSLMKALFKENRSAIFPNAKGSDLLLHSIHEGTFPNLISRGDDENWQMSLPKEIAEASLPNDGQLRYGTIGSTIFLLLRKPDNVGLKEFCNDSKLFMDTILKGFALHRYTGVEKTKITSLGKALDEYLFVDSYDRKWLVKTWLAEYGDVKVVTFCLPVPGGVVIMMRTGPMGSMDSGHIPDLKVFTNFISLSYEGTMREWEEFFSMKELLPAAFSTVSISILPGRHLTYASRRLSLRCPSGIIKASRDAVVKLNFGYFREEGRTVWDVAALSIGEARQSGTSLTIKRYARPPAALGEKYKREWSLLEQRKFPFDSSSFAQDKTTCIATILQQPDKGPVEVIYTLLFSKDGKADQKEMEGKLNLFTKEVSLCPGEPGTCSYPGRMDAYHDTGTYHLAPYDLRTIEAMAPRTAFGYVLRGEVHMEKGQYDSACRDYYEAVKMNKVAVAGKFGEDLPAILSGANGNFSDAYFELEKISKSDPFNTLAEPLVIAAEDALSGKISGETARHLFRAGAIRRISTMMEQAVEELNRAIAANPGYHIPYDMRGLMRVLQDTDSSIADYSKAIELDPRDVIAYNRRGVAYKMKKEYDRAMADHEAALRINSLYFKALHNKGVIYHLMGRYDEAIICYDASLQIYPRYYDTYQNRAASLEKKGEYDLAIRDCNKAIEIDPKSSGAYINRGNSYLKSGDYESALRDYNRAIELDPQEEGPYHGRGSIHSKRGDHDRAITDYAKAIEINPKDHTLYLARAASYMLKNELDKALSDLNKAIEIDPADFKIFLLRAELQQKRGNYDLAIYDFDEALEIKPDSSLAYLYRGVAYQKKGNTDQAIADVTKAIEIDPGLTEAYRFRGNMYLRNEALDLAMADFNKALQIDPRLAAAYYSRGTLQFKRGNFDAAILDFGEALKVAPPTAAVYAERGKAYGLKGDYDRSLADFNRALEIDSRDVRTLVSRGYTYTLSKRHREAIADYDRAIMFNPKYPMAYINRGISYYGLNEKGNACSDWTKACEYGMCDNIKRARSMGLCE